MTREGKERIDLRTALVEILSGTSNGCLAELGYFPGMTDKLQQSTQAVSRLQGDNARLYQDNCRLASTSKTMERHLRFLRAGENAQLAHLAQLERQLETSNMEKAALIRKNHEILNNKSPEAVYQQLLAEFQQLRAVHADALNQIQYLKDKYARLKEACNANTSLPPVHSPSGPPELRRPSTQSVQVAQNQPNERRVTSDGQMYLIPTPAQNLVHNMTTPVLSIRSGAQPILQQHQRRSSDGLLHQRYPAKPQNIAGWSPTSAMSSAMGSGQPSPVHAFFPPQSTTPLPTGRPHLPHAVIPPTHASYSSHRTVSAPIDAAPQHPARTPPPNSAPAVETSASPAKVIEFVDLTVDDVPEDTSAASAPTVTVPSPPPASEPSADVQIQTSLKRPNSAVDADSTSKGDGPAKKPRNGPQPDNSDLRSYEECVYMMFEEDGAVENAFYCEICYTRFEKGLLPEVPDLIVKPEFDTLLAHCMGEHPTVWEDLRHKRDTIQ
ncbi:hypothetical protein BV22DRAFT_46867 [Leucogyrophana mollusca]|uniref:Uncharacterized protein n=1 Tax=Leucogyrophana mollusca TaxID=85980 RepID=A0ACB8BXI3_9AGAM|nr:hypothetical protein BV22DRAFT_46867 [Leucogyrophana mollusca]